MYIGVREVIGSREPGAAIPRALLEKAGHSRHSRHESKNNSEIKWKGMTYGEKRAGIDRA